ncbi:hypothetical protein KUTeg_002114 [Tegillarca granosa]|uniref:Uncharacterized protein n=1 Tax=Tegillarca granosa TaxID=220873 RepID=A0ABQ9FTF2_TEGGR|nr:hypothetical protein KUTeg_002114 [Tegillarca granosa]
MSPICLLRTKKGELYHKNTLKNMRAAINRYFQDNNIKVDIVIDTKFKSCNRVLNGYMKNMTHTGVARPT